MLRTRVRQTSMSCLPIMIPGVGALPINAFVLMAEEPVLVDTGRGWTAGTSRLRSRRSSPSTRSVVWLTHDDADHTGSIQKVMELAPNATLVAQGLCALR